MSKSFKNSFSAGNRQKDTDQQANLRVKPGSRIDDVLRHYVSNSANVNANIQRSTSGEIIPMHGMIDANVFKNVTERRDIRNILMMNPNAQLAIDIVVGGTLSPNNSLDNSLQYISSYDKLGGVKTKLLQFIEEIVEGELKLNDNLPVMFRDAKYYIGSYATLVVPTSSIRTMINQTSMKERNTEVMRLESHFKDSLPKDYKSQAVDASRIKPKLMGFKMEDFKGDPSEKVSTEPLGDVLVHGDLRVLRFMDKAKREREDEDTYSTLNEYAEYSDYKPTGTAPMKVVSDDLKQENFVPGNNLTDAMVDGSIRRARGLNQQDVISLVPSDDFRDDDLAQTIHIPHEAIFVNHKPGKPDVLESCWIVLDMAGNPLSIEAELGYYNPNASGLYSNSSANSAMGAAANFSAGNLELGYGQQNAANMGMSNKSALFSKLMDEKLKDMVSEGDFTQSDISISGKRQMYEIMFGRLLSNKQTQMIYVPKNLMCYLAFEYDDNGNGQSLLIKHKEIGILNSILTMANTFAAINNAIDEKTINVEFDEDIELNTDKTINMIAGSLAKHTASSSANMMQTSPYKQIDYLGIAGYKWAFSKHPWFPGTSVTIESTPKDRKIPDQETVESNEAKLIQGLGTTPEITDSARGVEYAASYFQTNMLAARRAIADQKVLTNGQGGTTKLVQAFCLNSPYVIKELIRIIDTSRAELPAISNMKTITVVKAFINSLETKLPKPDMVRVESMANAIKAQEEFLTKALEYLIGEDAFPDSLVGDELANQLKVVRTRVHAIAMRDWLATNNMYRDPTLKAFASQDKLELANILTAMEGQQKFIVAALLEHGVLTELAAKEASEKFVKIVEARSGEGTSDSGGGSTSSDDTSSDIADTTDAGMDDDDDDPFGDTDI